MFLVYMYIWYSIYIWDILVRYNHNTVYWAEKSYCTINYLMFWTSSYMNLLRWSNSSLHTYWEVLNHETPFNIKQLILRWVGRHIVTMDRQIHTCDSVISVCAGLAAALEAACPMSSSQSHLTIPSNLTLTWITVSRIITTEQKYS